MIAFLGLEDQINRHIAYIIQGIGLIYEVIIEELGSYMVSVSGVITDISSFKGQGDSKKAYKGRGLDLPFYYLKGSFKDLL